MAEAQPAQELQLVKEGDYAVFDENGEKKAVLIVKAAANFKAGKSYVSMAAIIGQPYGSMFQVSADGKKLEKLDRPPNEAGTQAIETERNNSKLFDQNQANQTLKQEDIEQLRASGKSGEEIIEALCSNSATFETKTEFAQEKYKKRKAKKYCVTVTVRRPSARMLCDTFFEKSPLKTHNLRSDTLAIMLNLANIGAGAQTLIVEQCQGLIAAAVAERQGGHGHICCASVDSRAPSTDCVRFINQSAQQRSIISTATLEELQEAADQLQQQQAAPAAAPAATEQPQAPAADAADAEMPDAAADAPAAAEAPAAGSKPKQQHPRGAQRSTATPQLLQQLLQPGFSSCIVAAPRLHVGQLLQELLPLLQPSASFVVYSPYLQPLAEAQQQLSSSKQAVQLQVQESWLREHQVLPGRTHPMMVMTGTGGYVLSGTKVDSGAAPAQAGQQEGGGQKRPASAAKGQNKRQRR